MNTIGSRLKEERTKLGMTQEKMALAGGCTKRTQIYYEANKRSPDSSYLSLVAELGVDVNYILTSRREGSSMLKNGGTNFNEEDIRLLNMIKRLPEQQKKKEVADIEALLQSFDEAISHWIANNQNSQDKRQAA